MEQRLLEMQMACLTSDLDIAANICVEHRICILIIHQRNKILLTDIKRTDHLFLVISSLCPLINVIILMALTDAPTFYHWKLII